MKNLFKITRIALAVCMMITMFGIRCEVNATEVTDVIMTSSVDNAKAGDNIAISIATVDSKGILSMGFNIQYDAEVLQYVGDSWNYTDGVICSAENRDTYVKVNMDCSEGYFSNGVIVTLTFKVNAEVSDAQTTIKLTDASGVTCSVDSAVIAVKGEPKTEPTPDVDASAKGNHVVIVAPTSVPVATAAPTQAGSANSNQTVSIDINGQTVATPAPTEKVEESVDEEDSEEELDDEEEESDNKKESSSDKKPAKVSDDGNDDGDDVPKTGICRWEYILFVVALLSIGTGAFCVMRYVKSERA